MEYQHKHVNREEKEGFVTRKGVDVLEVSMTLAGALDLIS